MTGRGVNKLMERGRRRRWTASASACSTGELNRFFEQVLAHHPPPPQGGRSVRLYYVTQAQIEPPTFVVVTNHPGRRALQLPALRVEPDRASASTSWARRCA